MSNNHLVDGICRPLTSLLGGDEEAERTLAEWMKGMIETPEIKPGKAIALIGPPGCGKNMVVKVLRKMLGGDAVLETTAPERDLWGRHNGRMQDALVVCISEYNATRMARNVHHLKSLISDLNIVVTAPYQPMIEIASFHRVMITTNVAIPGARRIDEIKCHKPVGDATAHFNAFHARLEEATPDDLRRVVFKYCVNVRARQCWKLLRTYWRARLIGVYWHALTAKHMAPGGKMAKRDRAAYEA